MSNDKKDLTRIEDLGEFIHELNSEDEEITEDFPSELPDLPASDEEDPFGSSFSSNEEETSLETESDSPFGESTDFNSDESNSFATNDFSTDDFASSDFTSSSEDSPFASSESDETPDWNLSESNEEVAVETDSLFSEPEPETEPEEFKEIEEEKPEEVLSPLFDEAPLEDISTEEVPYTPSPEFKTPETFDDLKKFSESSSFTGMATEGNPSFSVLVKNVRFIEDVNDIISLLRELNLLIDSEEQTKSRLMRGMLLIPRVSEYAAIFMAHKLRRFDIDIQVGLSDEIHPPKHQETPETGIVSKFNLYQNQNHHFHFDDPKLELSQIIVAATSTLEGYQVLRYVGVASEHKMLDSHIVEDENSDEIPKHYQELAQKLKAHALKAHSNAVVGLNYQLTPIPSEFGMGGHKYRLTCTGNLVWVNKL